MIVSTLIFPILLVPLLLHGAPTSPHDDTISPQASRHSTDIGRPPGFANGMPPLPDVPPNVNAPPGPEFVWPDGFQHGKFPPPQIGPTVIQFQDFTKEFTYNGNLVEVPFGTYYLVSSSRRKKYLEVDRGANFQVDVIAVTPGSNSERYFVLIPSHTFVIMRNRDSGIKVPSDLRTRVVRISDNGLMRITLNCRTCYREGTIKLEEGQSPEIREQHFDRCYLRNIFNVGHPFIEEEVRRNVIQEEVRGRNRRPRR